ncbi:hypothetical protein LCGC14_2576460 [marine sediment metagenome]|uniref:Uncharacterized protein n=1 Tax=marine sediment metagenome TaxID=412755 RepID=A0A0F9AFT1_9ZZZZ
MQITIGKNGLKRSWQAEFPEEIPCAKCKGVSRIGFVAHEGMEEKLERDKYVCSLHRNKPKTTGYWLHDCCAVAVYFCTKCLNTTALYNQA